MDTETFQSSFSFPDAEESLNADAQTLLSLFPTCGRESLLHFFQLCGNDLNFTINNLLDSGYSMSDSESPESSPPLSSTNSPQKAERSNDGENKDIPSSGYPAWLADSTPSTSSANFVNAVESEIFDNQFEYGDNNQNSKKTSLSEIFETSEDSIKLQVPKEFVKQLVRRYGEQPGVEVSTLTTEDLIVEMSPELSFDLFNLLYNDVKRQELHADEEEEAVAGASAKPNAIEEDDQDLMYILRKIQELNESENKFLEWHMGGQEQSPYTEKSEAEFQSIVMQDTLRASEELARNQSLKSVKLNMAQNIKCSQLKHAFPSLKANIIEDVFRQCNFNHDVALNSLKDVYPSRYVTTSQNQESRPVVRSRTISGSDCSYDPENVAQMSPAEKRDLTIQAYDWKCQADDLVKAWQAARSTAEMQKSNKSVYSLYVLNATQYKHLANQALEKYWFYTLMSLNAGNKNANKIDLHGLSVNKAREIVQKYLQNRKTWASNNLPKNATVLITIITGQGRHSVNNVPKLNPAIRQFLMDNHYAYTGGESVGSFTVRLLNKEEKSAYKRYQQPRARTK